MKESKKLFSKLVLDWWKDNKRDFPWRRTKNSYFIIIAEMLLRKTTAFQVEKVYICFLEKYPTPKSLAEADIDGLRNLLTPLGMEHKRAELFKKFGTAVEEKYGGKVPSKIEELLKLPGVGMYTANAVLSLVYLKDVPLLDTNFIRVIQRVFGIESEKQRARSDKKIWDFAQTLIPPGNSKNFNLAVLDFAALICKTKNPKCSVCPLESICAYSRKTH